MPTYTNITHCLNPGPYNENLNNLLRIIRGLEVRVNNLSGTVSSVDFSAPSIFTITGNPITTSGTINLAFNSQTQNTIFAAPHVGNGLPTFRTLDISDIPNVYALKTTTITAAGNGIIGGGSFAANRIFSLDFTYLDARYSASGSGVISFNGRTGVITPASNDYTFAQIGSTPTTLSGYGIIDAQSKLNGTGFVKANGTTISYDNSTYLTTINGIASGGELSGTYPNPTLSNSAVIGKVLTGYVSGSGIVSSSDTILSAIQKLNGNISNISGNYVTSITGTANQVISSSSTGAVILSLPQDIAISSSPIFANLNLSSLTQDNSSGEILYYNDSNGQITWEFANFIAGVTGTPFRIDVSFVGGGYENVDISTSYVGQPSITTVGTLTTGTIGAGFTAIANARLANSSVTVQGVPISLGSSGNIINGTGFVKATGTTISYDNSIYLTTASATSTYAPISGSANYIQNTTSVQASSNFNISANGVVGGTLQAVGYTSFGDNHSLATNAVLGCGTTKNVVSGTQEYIIEMSAVYSKTGAAYDKYVVGISNHVAVGATNTSNWSGDGVHDTVIGMSSQIDGQTGGTGTILSAVSYRAVGSFFGGNTWTTYKGLDIAMVKFDTAVITNAYGVYVGTMGAATNKWSIYTVDGLAYIGGTLQINGSTTLGSAGLITTGSTSGNVTIKSTTGTWTMNLPVSAGTNTYVLQTDGSGNTSWVPPSATAAALTKTDDTNVTLTLGGTPASALLAATSLTLGWTGTLADGRIASATNWNTAYTNRIISLTVTGSSGAATLISNVLNIPTYTFNGLSPMTTAGDIIYGGASGVGTRLAAGTSVQVLHGGATPSWSAVSLTADVSGTLPIANGGTGLTSTSQNFVFAGPTSGSGAPTWRALVAGDIPALLSGTTNYLPKFTSSTAIGNSILYQGTLTDMYINATTSVYAVSGRGYIGVNGSSSAMIEFMTGGASRGLMYHDGTDFTYQQQGSGKIYFNTTAGSFTLAATTGVFSTSNNIVSGGTLTATTINANGSAGTVFLTHSSGTITSRTAAQVLADIGAGSGTVTSVSVVTANGVSGSVATSTTTPAITLILGAITPSSVASTGVVSGTVGTFSAASGTQLVLNATSGQFTQLDFKNATNTKSSFFWDNSDNSQNISIAGNVVGNFYGSPGRFNVSGVSGSNTISLGPGLQISATTGPKSILQQLNGSNGLDWWFLSGSWSKQATLSTSGDFTTNGSHTGTAASFTTGTFSSTTNVTGVATFVNNIVGQSGLTLLYSAKTTTYSILTTDYTIDCTSGTFTTTLPTAVGVAGKMYVIKNSGAGVITIATTSSQTIDGVTTKTLNTQYSGFKLMSDGANWKIVSTF